MKLSVIVATKDRAHSIAKCLHFIAAAFANASPIEAEIVVVDNGSSDDTSDVVRSWALKSGLSVNLLFEPRVGKARALNLALRKAKGEILAFTDDDCRLDGEYVNDLMRHDAADNNLVVRGGRVELGDPSDLPFTINTKPTRMRWSLAENSARVHGISGQIIGANTMTRRKLFDVIGPFDESLGPGSAIGSGEDTDVLFRAYLAGATLEYVPDTTVFHYHGRKTNAEAIALWRQYMIGIGALYMKYLFKHPNFCVPLWWDAKAALKEIKDGTNSFIPSVGFSHRDKILWSARGAFKYAVHTIT